MSEKDYRKESDSMGELKVPSQAQWGAQTQRAIENFQISDIRVPRKFISALGGFCEIKSSRCHSEKF